MQLIDLLTLSRGLIEKIELILKIKRVQNMAKGGRAGFKSGSKGCKFAMKGKGRAYGKNS